MEIACLHVYTMTQVDVVVGTFFVGQERNVLISEVVPMDPLLSSKGQDACMKTSKLNYSKQN